MQNRIFAELLKHRWELFGFIRALVHNTQDAEDLFQNVATVIVEQAEEGEKVRDFRAWAKEIARRQVFKHFRDRKSRRLSAVPVDEMVDVLCEAWTQDASTPAQLTEEHEALRGCLEQLPGESAQLIKLRFLADLAYRDIARQLSKNEEAVRRAVSRARLALTACVRGKLGLTEGGA